MEYYFSRHAKRRAKLYNLDLDDIVEILGSSDLKNFENFIQNEIIDSRFSDKYGYPLKIIFRKEELKIIIITNYPLKRKLYEN